MQILRQKKAFGSHISVIILSLLLFWTVGAADAADTSGDVGGREEGGVVNVGEPVEMDPTLPLTLDNCVKIALERHPDIALARSRIDSQRARVGQSAAPARPRVSVSPSYSYSYTETSGQRGNINTDFSLSQTIFDSNQTGLSIRAAEQELSARVWDTEETVQNLISAVIDSYYMVNRTSRTLGIASERVENYESRLKWAQDFYRVGTKAKIEVTRAESDLATARLDYVTAYGAQQRAVANLAHAIGMPVISPTGIDDLLSYREYDVAIEEALATAMIERADVKAQNLRLDAARTSLQLAAKGLSPTVTGSAGYSLHGETDPVDQKDWKLSVGVSIPLFDGGLTREEIKQAEADLSGVEATREALRQDIILEVRNAHTVLLEAKESVKASLEAERQAKETLDLAQGRYKAGVGESLEISDAVDAYARAQMNVVTSLYSHRAAEIELKRVMGVMNFEED